MKPIGIGRLVALSTIALIFLAVAAVGQNYRQFTREHVPGAGGPTPPGQPTEGPGGADYKFAGVAMHTYGQNEYQCSIFEPAKPAPASAPVVVFLHGWLAMDPATYGRWINHLVLKGNIVIFPAYQVAATPGDQFTTNAVKTVKRAIQELQQPGHVKPDLNKFALVGHSAGATIAVNMAAQAAEQGLPKPGVLMSVEPGRWLDPNRKVPALSVPLADLSTIPAETLIIILVGDADERVGTGTAREIYDLLKQVPAENKNLIKVQSDDHGTPPLVADHYFPGNKPDGSVSPLAYYACWRLLDSLMSAAFFQGNRAFALGDTPMQKNMGSWSDGRPVNELVVAGGENNQD